MKTVKKLIAAAFTLSALCALRLAAQAKPVVAIAPFDAKDIPKDEVDVLSEVLISEYANTGFANVVDRTSFDKIKAQLNFQASDWSDVNKVAQFGKALNANQVVVGKMITYRSYVITTFKVLDVNSTAILAARTEKVHDVKELFNLLPSVCKELAAKAAEKSTEPPAPDMGNTQSASSSNEKPGDGYIGN